MTFETRFQWSVMIQLVFLSLCFCCVVRYTSATGRQTSKTATQKSKDAPRSPVLYATIRKTDLPHGMSLPTSCTDKNVITWRVLAETTNSPNVLIIEQSDLKKVRTMPQTGPQTGLLCELTLWRNYIWAEPYYLLSQQITLTQQIAAVPSYMKAGLTSATFVDEPEPSDKPGSQMWFEKTFPALSVPGAIDAQFSYSPGFGATDQTDVKIGLLPYWRLEPIKGWLGYSILWDYDSRPQKNPDALIFAWTYAFRFARPSWIGKEDANLNKSPLFRVRPCGLNAKVAGLEYAPENGDLNYISALSCGIPIIVNLRHQPSWLTLTPSFGFETGVNLETAGNVNPPEFIFRGVPGADASIRWLKTSLFGDKPVTLTGKYRARIPIRDEPFTDAANAPSGAPLPAPILTTRTRHYADAQVSIPIFKTFSIALTYQYGSLPPAFINFGQSIMLGIKATSPGDYEH